MPDNRSRMPAALGTNPAALREAVQLLRDGRVVAYPTDTLYGLAVDPRNPDAVRRLFALKGRADTSALTLIAADAEQAQQAGEFNALASRLAARWWPGPLTIVMSAKAILASETLAGGTTVGIRVPDHPVAQALAREFGFCITATSANRSGANAAATAGDVIGALPELDAVIDAGSVAGGAPSTLVSVQDERVTLLREGAVAWDRVIKSLQ
jgi:L-threonylcarbamoyladenylate synthase